MGIPKRQERKEENVIRPKDSPSFASGLCFAGSVLGQWELLGKHLRLRLYDAGPPPGLTPTSVASWPWKAL